MSIYRLVKRTLENNGFYESSLYAEEYEHGHWIVGVTDTRSNDVMEHWATIFDDELGSGWEKDVEITYGPNPNPTMSFLMPYAVHIELW